LAQREICFEFSISIFELPSVSHRIGITYRGPQPEVEGSYETTQNLNSEPQNVEGWNRFAQSFFL
jgi:hypothetical protein